LRELVSKLGLTSNPELLIGSARAPQGRRGLSDTYRPPKSRLQPSGYPRATQGLPKGATPGHHRSNPVPVPGAQDTRKQVEIAMRAGGLGAMSLARLTGAASFRRGEGVGALLVTDQEAGAAFGHAQLDVVHELPASQRALLPGTAFLE
jgi:hypothetical protein